MTWKDARFACLGTTPARYCKTWSLAATLWLLAFDLFGTLHAADWPTYRHDISRSGVTSENLALPLFRQWEFAPHQAPERAWEDPPVGPMHRGKLEHPRLRFDDAYQVVSADGAVYFGAGVENTIYSLSADTGEVRWVAFTDAAVRFAPTLCDGRVYVGCDDGYVYCLDAADGRVVWKFRAAPTELRVLGNGRMTSLWPVRTSVLVDEGIAYFGAGVYPTEGIYMYAVDAATGRLRWQNDSHTITEGRSLYENGTVSPQGYLLASQEELIVPAGRLTPVVLSREDGAFLGRPRTGFFGYTGGVSNTLADGHLFHGTEMIIAVDLAKHVGDFRLDGLRVLVSDRFIYLLTGKELIAYQREPLVTAARENSQVFSALKRSAFYIREFEKGAASHSGFTFRAEQYTQQESRKELARWKATQADALAKQGQAEDAVEASIAWRTPWTSIEPMILAGDTLFAGDAGHVVAFEAGSGRTLWTGPVDGTASGMAVAEGRLFVSSSEGAIHCFAGRHVESAPRMVPSKTPMPDSSMANLAPAILKETGVRRGFALILGGTGELACALAKETELIVHVVHPDREVVARARRRLSGTGLYGARVCIDCAPLDRIPYADYFANLIVSAEASRSGELTTPPGELLRLLKPHGGVALVGQLDTTQSAKPAAARNLKRWLDELDRDSLRIDSRDSWAKITRGALPGTGSWTHQYAEPGNTACSDDHRVAGPLGILWFGRPGPKEMIDRHFSAAAPLVVGGRLFVHAKHKLAAYDAYNGVQLWQREMEYLGRTGTKSEAGNMAASQHDLFVAGQTQCFRIDPASGKILSTFQLPDGVSSGRGWGYVAWVDGLLYGSHSVAPGYSNAVFAVDPKTGRYRWVYRTTRIRDNTIAIGGGRLYLVTTEVTDQQRQDVLSRLPEAVDDNGVDRKGQPNAPDVRLAVALSASTGAVLWQKPLDVTDCVRDARRDRLMTMYKDELLLLSTAMSNGHAWNAFMKGDFSETSIIAVSAKDGSDTWSSKLGYRIRPAVVGDTIYAEPWSFDLHTGEPRMRSHPITGEPSKWQMARPGHHCGFISACPNMLFYRSGSVAVYDLLHDSGTMHFGGQRPGCGINVIPAGGLVVIPEASAGCTCPYPIAATVVLQPRQPRRMWSTFSAPGNLTPVRHLAMNFGAPGDRRSESGRLWIGYPRLTHADKPLVLKLNLNEKLLPGGGFYQHNPNHLPVTGVEDPWLFTSGVVGLAQLVVPLDPEAKTRATYTVRMGFAAPGDARPGRRVFDVKLNGRVAASSFDVGREAGGPPRGIVKTFQNVHAQEDLVIEFVPAVPQPAVEQLPIVSFVEVIRVSR